MVDRILGSDVGRDWIRVCGVECDGGASIVCVSENFSSQKEGKA